MLARTARGRLILEANGRRRGRARRVVLEWRAWSRRRGGRRFGTKSQMPMGEQQRGDDGESRDGARDRARRRALLHDDVIKIGPPFVEMETVTKSA